MGLSIGLGSAISALIAQRTAMDVVGHNVANIGTAGYTRQRVVMSAVAPAGGAGVGSGVAIDSIQGVRDLFLDFQLRAQNSTASEYQSRADSLNIAQTLLNEPGTSGLGSVMDAFFNSWSDLANAPEQGAARANVVQAGQTFAAVANNLVRSFSSLRDSADARVTSAVDQVNTLATKIASLNSQIVSVKASGDTASDLVDQRSAALDQLSQLADIRYTEHDNGSVDVFVGGHAIVTAGAAQQINTTMNPANNNYADLTWASDGSAVNVSSGQIGGLIYQRDTDLTARIGDLNTLVHQVITDVNTAHAAGYAADGVTTGTAFFQGTDAVDIAVAANVVAQPSLLAAARVPGAIGDGSNALAIADLQTTRTLSSGGDTYDTYYGGIVARVGSAAQSVQGLSDAQHLSVNHLQQLQQSTSGVNLDEEMTNMIQYQRGYEASARMIRTISDMLDTLINKT